MEPLLRRGTFSFYDGKGVMVVYYKRTKTYHSITCYLNAFKKGSLKIPLTESMTLTKLSRYGKNIIKLNNKPNEALFNSNPSIIDLPQVKTD